MTNARTKYENTEEWLKEVKALSKKVADLKKKDPNFTKFLRAFSDYHTGKTNSLKY